MNKPIYVLVIPHARLPYVDVYPNELMLVMEYCNEVPPPLEHNGIREINIDDALTELYFDFEAMRVIRTPEDLSEAFEEDYGHKASFIKPLLDEIFDMMYYGAFPGSEVEGIIGHPDRPMVKLNKVRKHKPK